MADLDSAEGTATSNADDEVNYVEGLKAKLREQDLMKIADAILEINDEPLESLLEYDRKDIVETIRDIHEGNDNQYSFKAVHRNRFAKIVVEFGKKQRDGSAAKSPSNAPAASLSTKLLFLGKAEEEAIEAIETGAQTMKGYQNEMKGFYNSIHANNEKVKADLESSVDLMKKKIEEKQKYVLGILENIHNAKMAELNERNETTNSCAKCANQCESEYPSYFSGGKLSKQERKQKLVDAKNLVHSKLETMKQFTDLSFDISFNFNEARFDKLLDQSMDLSNIGLKIDPLEVEVTGNASFKWDKPELSEEVKKIFGNDNELSGGQLSIMPIVAQPFKDESNEIESDVRSKDDSKSQDDAKDEVLADDDHDDSKVDIITDDNLQWKAVCYETDALNKHGIRGLDSDKQIAMYYLINNVLRSPISQSITLPKYEAVFSSSSKGPRITLSENDTKATLSKGKNQCVRFRDPIVPGMKVKLKFNFYCCNVDYDGVGVWSAQSSTNICENGNLGPRHETITHFYGMNLAHATEQFYYGQDDNTYFHNCGWDYGTISTNAATEIVMLVDYSNPSEGCKLSFYRDGDLKAPQNAEYSMLAPVFAERHWYPIVAFEYLNNWCKVETLDL